MTVSEINTFLSQMKITADSKVAHCRFGPGPFTTSTGRAEPRVTYVQQILWLWTHRFRGKLKFSVDLIYIPDRVYGPLVDYVAAVSGPVMKQAAPKASGLRDIVKRQKQFYVLLSEFQRKHGRVIEPVTYDRAVPQHVYGDVPL